MDNRARYGASLLIRDKILECLHPRPRAIALFGSFARGQLHAASDIDVLLIGDEIPKKPYDRAVWFHPVSTSWDACSAGFGLKHSLSPLFVSSEGWLNSMGLRLSLCEQLLILLDDGFLSDSMHESRKEIYEKKWIRRETEDGGWLWFPMEEVA